MTNTNPFVPTIETERLILRRHTISDFTKCHEMWTDEIVARYTIGKPSTIPQTWSRLLHYVGHWALMGFGYWAVEEKTSKSFIGEIGFANFKRAIVPTLGDRPEIGWVLSSSAHGKGYATEAIRAALQWGDIHLDTDKIVCIIQPENARSIHIAEKFGFKWAHDAVYNDSSVRVYYSALSHDSASRIL